MKQQILLGVLVAVLLAGAGIWYFRRSNPHGNALQTRELATWGLAQYLAKTRPGQRALVLSNPFAQRKGTPSRIVATEEAGIRGLKAGFGTNVTLEAVVFPELKPEAADNPRAVYIDPETTTPLSYLVAEDAFDTLAAQYAQCGILVSLIGLPADLDRVQCWNTDGPPCFALLLPDLRMAGDTEAVNQAVKSGKLAAFVLSKPGAPDPDSPMAGDEKAEFEKRFVLVTPETIDDVIQSYPSLF